MNILQALFLNAIACAAAGIASLFAHVNSKYTGFWHWLKHPRIAQKAQGQMGGSFNTREFFHGRGLPFVRAVKWIFLLVAFARPVLLMSVGLAQRMPSLLVSAFIVQYAGLLAERWFFFAQARHPQNLCYPVIS